MPVRFSKVTDNLYRGGAPEDWEVTLLKNTFGITKIISLDEKCGNNIKDVCQSEGLKHLIIPIHSTDNLIKELQILYAGVNNIMGDDICYVHCRHGKDRTGTFVAKYRVENGWDCETAINEALEFGFGSGVDEQTIQEYINCVIHSCKSNHSHIGIYEVMDKIGKTALCEDCGCLKKQSSAIGHYCKHCLITDALIKNAHVLNIDISSKNTKKEDSSMNTLSYKFQMKLLKAQQMSKLANEQKISFQIPENELKIAAECLEYVKDFSENIVLKVKSKDKNKELLDIISEPFGEDVTLTQEQLKKTEKFVKLFAELYKNNIIKIKQGALHILDLMEIFNSGEKVEAILSSLFDIVDNLDKESTSLIAILDDVEDKDFQKNLVNAIKIVKKRSAQLKQLLNERLIEYLRKDILGEDWSTEIKKDIVDDKQEQQKNMRQLNLKQIK